MFSSLRGNFPEEIFFLGTSAALCITAAELVVQPGLVALVLLTIVVVCIAVLHPAFGAWLLVALTPVETVGPLGFTATKAAKLGLTVLVACVLLGQAFRRSAIPAADPYRWPFCLLLLSGFFASVGAASPSSSMIGLASLIAYVLIYQAVRCSRVFAENGRRLLNMVLWSAVPVAVLCLAQLTLGYGGMLGSREQQATEAQGQLSTLWPSIERACGLFNGPTAAGAFLALTAVMALAHAIAIRRSRAIYILLALLALAGVLATFSRGALLGYLAGALVATWVTGFWTRRRILFVFAPLAIVARTAFADETIRAYLRIGTDLVSTSASRVDAWNAAFTIIPRHPVFGIGFYGFQEMSQGIEGQGETPLHAHNGLLKALVEQGPVGAAGYLLFLWAFFREARNTARTIDRENKWVLAAIFGAGASLFTQELFDANLVLGGSSIAILFAALLGLEASLKSVETNDHKLVAETNAAGG